jgi:hypothetical protein
LPEKIYLHFESGPEFTAESANPPYWHIEKGIELLEHEGYEAFIQYFNDPFDEQFHEVVPDGAGQRETCYSWFHSGGQGKQPIIDDLGVGGLNYFFKSEEDANRFMKEYAKQYNVTDLSNYERVEVEISDVVNGGELEDEILTPEILRELEASEESDEEDSGEQSDIEKF